MSGWWMHDLFHVAGAVGVVAWIFWVIFSITLHELAHGWAALRLGDGTPRELGHMTANPLVHMGLWSLVMFALIGIAWGLMPTDPSRYRNGRRGRAFVAIAGPAMNLGLAAVAIVGAGLVLGISVANAPPTAPGGASAMSLSPAAEAAFDFFRYGALLNVVLALFNLLPIPPLDGSQVLSGLSLRASLFYSRPEVQQWGLVGLIAVFFILRVDVGFFTAAHIVSDFGIALIAGLFV